MTASERLVVLAIALAIVAVFINSVLVTATLLAGFLVLWAAVLRRHSRQKRRVGSRPRSPFQRGAK